MKVEVKSPCSGCIWMLAVGVGGRVFEGNNLITVESMKMEISVDSPCDGEVVSLAAQGTNVNEGDVIAVIEDGT